MRARVHMDENKVHTHTHNCANWVSDKKCPESKIKPNLHWEEPNWNWAASHCAIEGKSLIGKINCAQKTHYSDKDGLHRVSQPPEAFEKWLLLEILNVQIIHMADLWGNKITKYVNDLFKSQTCRAFINHVEEELSDPYNLLSQWRQFYRWMFLADRRVHNREERYSQV